MTATPRIVLLHATPVAIDPIRSAMARLWPGAEVSDLLDDGLTLARARDGEELSDGLVARFVALGHYAAKAGADGILVTCSAFGPAIDQLAAELSIPVLKPNEAMFRAAIAAGTRVGMLATFAPSVPTMEAEFRDFVRETGAQSTLDTVVVGQAIDLLRKGDAETHNRLVGARASDFAGYDAIMLAHFSTSRAAEAVRAGVRVPVFTAPDAAVVRMRELVEA